MEDELILDVMLEPHDQVVPNGAESGLVLTHLGHHAGVNVGIEVPALNILSIFPLDRYSDAKRNDVPRGVVCRISNLFLLVQWR